MPSTLFTMRRRCEMQEEAGAAYSRSGSLLLVIILAEWVLPIY
jgi:hypothetical protein